MTDDPTWLDTHAERVLGIKNISAPLSFHKNSTTTRNSRHDPYLVKNPAYKDIRVFTLASKRSRSFDQFEANVDFWASIELARQCQGIIIHPGSAVARVIALSMCYRNSGVKYMQCPNFFDISGN